MQRLFFSLKLTDTQQQQLLAYQQQVLSLCPGARPVATDNLHLTLFFLGQVDGETKQQLVAEAQRITIPGFVLTLDRLSGFSGPKIVYLAPSQAPSPLLALQQQLAVLCKKAGFDDIHDSYQPHITLARQAVFADKLPVSPLTLEMSQFALYQSGQFDGRLQYRPLQCFSLL